MAEDIDWENLEDQEWFQTLEAELGQGQEVAKECAKNIKEAGVIKKHLMSAQASCVRYAAEFKTIPTVEEIQKWGLHKKKAE